MSAPENPGIGVSRTASKIGIARLFRILGNEVIFDLVRALSTHEFTMPGLCKKLGQKKPLLCMYLTELHQLGIIEKARKRGKMRYRLKARDVVRLFWWGNRIVEGLPPSDDIDD